MSLAYSILSQQIEQIGNLTSKQVEKGRKTIMLYFNTIGRKGSYDFVERECSAWNHLKCIHLKHYSEGFEMVTLNSLWHYCQTNPTHTVTYVHPKGSFHPSEGNNLWRVQLTAGAFNDQCIDPPDHRCNVCGTGFQSAWGPLFLGNMWTAKCSYVKELIDPFHVEEKYVAAFEAKPSVLTASFYRYGAFSIPTGRYQAEVFVGTHPSIMPCGIHYDKKTNHSFWSMMPLDNFPANIGSSSINWRRVVNGGGHRTEWFLLPGLLWRSSYIYDSYPPTDSWVWSYFPDGKIWKELLRNVTIGEAIDTMANHSRQE